MTRHLAAILTADAIGFSVLMTEDEARSMEVQPQACAAGGEIQFVRLDAVCRGDCLLASSR